MNISSIVVKTKPEHVQEVRESLDKSGLCEVYLHDDQGRIIVTIEGKDVNEEMNKVKQIHDISHVLSAQLSYSYSDEEFKNAAQEFKKIEDAVPDALKDDSGTIESTFRDIKKT